ncbi:DUF2017 family protein [Microbacterium sp. Clip185]|uniref:DUF2017 family protein n=1 Tax=Microbacterium sp. Clip185 TaxID=3025663 RepID=UPI0023651598|nr:DUF2017 family protein [Microbacterium sp. Clip185]WDG16693.1 DUF2017 family protein [Microbacterium sp. Clip185]
MSDAVVISFTRVEAVHLRGLVGQFVDLLSDADAASDPAVSRLTPSAYPDDAASADQFRAATRADLLRRRSEEAATVLADLASAGELDPADDHAFDEALTQMEISLEPRQVAAWLRTLNAARLVLAERLGIDDEDDHPADDPRFGVYEWLGYRLELLIGATEDV